MRIFRALLYTILFVVIILAMLLIGSVPMAIILIGMWLWGIIVYIINGGQIPEEYESNGEFSGDNFSTKDMMYAKIGEWINKR